MFPDELSQLIPIFGQIPIVFLFIWYNDRKDKQFVDALAAERKAYHDALMLDRDARAAERKAYHDALLLDRDTREKFSTMIVASLHALQIEISKQERKQ
jgi:hypothetical protein